MKKLLSFLVAVSLCYGIAAQDSKVKDNPVEKKNSSLKKVKNEPGSAPLDGRAFKISFTGKKMPLAEDKQQQSKDNNVVNSQNSRPEYPAFDVNSKVILSFANGNIFSPIFEKSDCPYRLNTSGNKDYSFTASCRLNSGNEPATAEGSKVQDTKMEIDAAPKNMSGTEVPDLVNGPNSMPPDETKQHLPPGTDRENIPEMNNGAAKNISPPVPTKSEEIEWQSKSPVQVQTGYLATMSGVVSGNSIEGTLSWTDADGQKVSYSYTGHAATKKDADESNVVGMK